MSAVMKPAKVAETSEPKPERKEASGLALLREPFKPNQISKLPKPTKAQTDAVRADFRTGIRCGQCGAWHHPDVVHLDYVGHAALTDRLLDVDPSWQWEPLAYDAMGFPALDMDGGMWIKLTVCGVTRLGYGDAQGKKGPDATKERIGDALRNAAMRFGAALDLWHKGVLHIEEEPEEAAPKIPATDQQIAALNDYAETDLMTEGQKGWLKAKAGSITEAEAAFVLKKLKEKEQAQ